VILVLIFAIGYSVCSTAVLAEQEKTVQEKKEAAETAIISEIHENSRALKKTVAKEQEVPEKQKDAKPEGTSAAKEKIKDIIAEIEEEQKAAAEAEEELMQEITGLIIEETMTKIGYDFYEYFFLLWETPEVELKDYNILISERASPMWGSLVEVKIGETTVWSNMLRPRSAEIEESAQQAIEATKNYLRNYEKYQLKTIDMMGTGI